MALMMLHILFFLFDFSKQNVFVLENLINNILGDDWLFVAAEPCVDRVTSSALQSELHLLQRTAHA